MSDDSRTNYTQELKIIIHRVKDIHKQTKPKRTYKCILPIEKKINLNIAYQKLSEMACKKKKL